MWRRSSRSGSRPGRRRSRLRATGRVGGRRHLAGQHERPDLTALVGHRVVQGVRADVAPEPVERRARRRRPGPEDLEDARGQVERDVRGLRLHRRDADLVLAARPLGERVGVTVDAQCLVGAPRPRAPRPPRAATTAPRRCRARRARRRRAPGHRAATAGSSCGCTRPPSRAPRGDTEVETDEDELDDRDVHRVVDPRRELLVAESRGVRPRHAHTVERDAARFGETLPDVVPVVVERDRRLVRRDDREDVRAGPLDDSLEHGDVGDLRARGERLLSRGRRSRRPRR